MSASSRNSVIAEFFANDRCRAKRPFGAEISVFLVRTTAQTRLAVMPVQPVYNLEGDMQVSALLLQLLMQFLGLFAMLRGYAASFSAVHVASPREG